MGSRRRWIADEVSGNRAALTGTHADHLTRVLRVRMGQEFDIATGGEVRKGSVVSIAAGRVEFALGEQVPAQTTFILTVALSIFKFDRMEWAIEKCTELGATRIVPVVAHRTDTHLAAAAPNRVERWQRIARQASEQSRRAAPLEISAPIRLMEAIALPGSERIVLSESEETMMLKDVVRSHPAGDVVLAFGPEGGWTEAELELFSKAGWIAASLGATILRAETAAIAATAVVVAELQ